MKFCGTKTIKTYWIIGSIKFITIEKYNLWATKGWRKFANIKKRERVNSNEYPRYKRIVTFSKKG